MCEHSLIYWRKRTIAWTYRLISFFPHVKQVFDEGRLTDSHGRTVDFRNTIIVLTSNLGADYLSSLPPDQPSSMARDDVMRVVRGSFAPEFLNRIDDIVLFNRLRREDMDRIVMRQIKIVEGLLAERGLGLEVDEAVVRWLADQGYDPSYGARPLKRTMQVSRGIYSVGALQRRCTPSL